MRCLLAHRPSLLTPTPGPPATHPMLVVAHIWMADPPTNTH